jgi:hypothetical protein
MSAEDIKAHLKVTAFGHMLLVRLEGLAKRCAQLLCPAATPAEESPTSGGGASPARVAVVMLPTAEEEPEDHPGFFRSVEDRPSPEDVVPGHPMC